MSLIRNKKKILFIILIISIFSIFTLNLNTNQIYGGNTNIRYFLKYDSFKKTFSNEIKDISQAEHQYYKVYFDKRNVVKTEYHYFSQNDYIIYYFKGTDESIKEITYKDIKRDYDTFNIIKNIKEKYNINTSYLYSIIYYENGNITRSELYRNGKLIAYKKRYYETKNEVSYPKKEEHWEINYENGKDQALVYDINSEGKKQKVYDKDGYELKTVWLYDELGFYMSEDYENGKLKYYHKYYYQSETRNQLENLRLDLKDGEITKDEYKVYIKDVIRNASSVIKQIDDFKNNGDFKTRRFYTSFSTLMEIWYYDKDNNHRLTEYYNPDGHIRAIDIKNEKGITISSYDNTEVDMDFFIDIRNEITGNN